RHAEPVELLERVFLGQFYLVRNLVFAGLFHAFGPDPRPYFWSVLLTHAVNVLLLERAIRGFTGDLVLYHEPVLTAALAPRYQYLPLAFLALMLCIALASLRSGSRAAARTVYAAAVVWVLARTVVLLLRPLPIHHPDWAPAA